MPTEQLIKVHLKTAQVEIEYEGNESFLQTEMLTFIKQIAEIHKNTPPLSSPSGSKIEGIPTDDQGINLSVSSIASKLIVESGPDLILASCAYLSLVKKQETFTRKNILDSMKLATTYYKKSYSSNLSSYLDRLIKDDKILQQANDVYALSVQIKNVMVSKLGS